MSELEFLFQEVLTEIDALSKVAERFIAPESREVLPELKGTLELIQDNPSSRIRPWGIDPRRPLRTIVSRHRDAFNLYAEITSIWQIRSVREAGGRFAPDRFVLAGLTSTRVQLRARADNREIVTWRMEVGDSRSPGCHFHSQLGTLSAPRLPAIHTTPLAVLELVLGEVFQDAWDREVAGNGPELQRWGPIHRRWLEQVLNWQLAQVRRSGGAPWTTLKRTKPPHDLFVEAG